MSRFALKLSIWTFLAFALGGMLFSPAHAASRIYWTDAATGKIQRADLDGTNLEDVVTGLFVPYGLAINSGSGKIYWTPHGLGKVQQANLDGTNIQDLVTGLSNPHGIAVDSSGGQLYWVDHVTDKVQRANLDGSHTQDLVVSGLVNPHSISLDLGANKVYWVDSMADKIQRANLDGTNVENVLTGLESPFGLALDVAGGKLYWTDSSLANIQRADLDGGNVEELFSGSHAVLGIVLDVSAGKMYWIDGIDAKIQRANLDGTGVEDVVTGLGNPLFLAIQKEMSDGEFSVSAASGHQQNQVVVWNPDDQEYFVIWHDKDNLDIRGARLDQDGQMLASELPLVVDSERQAGPWIAHGGGGYFAVWIQGRATDATGTDVHGAWILPDGTVQSTFVVADQINNQRAASAKYDPVQNRFLITWIDDGGTVSNRDIWGAVWLPGGTVYSAPAPIVATGSDQRGPFVRYDYGNGRYYMVWFDDRNGDYDVFGMRVDAEGNALDGTGLAITTAAGHQKNPRVTDRRPDNGITHHVVAWVDFLKDIPPAPDIRGALVDGDGVKSGVDFEIIMNSSQQRAVNIDIDYVRTQQAVIGFIDNRNGSNYDIYRVQVDQSGGVSVETEVAGSGTGAPDEQRGPFVVYSDVSGADNGLLFLWRDLRGGSDYDILGKKVFP